MKIVYGIALEPCFISLLPERCSWEARNSVLNEIEKNVCGAFAEQISSVINKIQEEAKRFPYDETI